MSTSRPAPSSNKRKVMVSEQAGKSNILAELERIGLKVNKDDPRISRLLEIVKEREAIGYAYEAADASFELLARRTSAPCRVISTSPNSTSTWNSATTPWISASP